MEKIHIIIGTIGRGKNSNPISNYSLTEYQFPDGSRFSNTFFTISLYKYLTKKEKIKNLYTIIYGTNSSTWSELIQFSKEFKAIPKIKKTFMDILWEKFNFSSKKDKEELREKYKIIKEASEEGKISEDLLKDWEEYLNNVLNPNEKRIFLSLISIEEEWKESVELEVIDQLYKNIKQIIENHPCGTEPIEVFIHFDITHSIRILPIILTYALFPILLKLNLKLSIKFYYGAYELGKNNITPVIETEFPQKMIEIYNAYLIFKVFGYFPEIFRLVSKINKGLDLEDLYYKLKTKIFPINDLKKENIKSLTPQNLSTIYKDFFDEIQKDLLNQIEEMQLNKNLTWEMLLKQAKWEYDHRNYNVAIIILFEAAMAKLKNQIDKTNRSYFLENYNKMIECLSDERLKQIMKELKNLRNAIVHLDFSFLEKKYYSFNKFHKKWEEFYKTIKDKSFNVNC